MRAGLPLLVLVSVLLSAAAQLLLKLGMSGAPVQLAVRTGGVAAIARAVAASPVVIAGFAVFGLSALVWVFVLSKIDVSYAYPCVALGIVITMLGGHYLFGEAIPPLRLLGLAIIVAGVGVVVAAR